MRTRWSRADPVTGYEFSAPLWLTTNGSWYFITVPAAISERIREFDDLPRPGFGAVRVEVTVGATTWRTSVFPESASGCYVMPMKKAVRSAERLDVDDRVRMRLVVLAR